MQRIPFNWRSPFGYSIIVTIQYIIEACVLLIAGCAVVFAIGNYLFLITMSKLLLKVRLSSISQNAGDESERRCLIERPIEFLKFHSRVKQLSQNRKQIIQRWMLNSLKFLFIIRWVSNFSYSHIPTYHYHPNYLVSVKCMRFNANDANSIGIGIGIGKLICFSKWKLFSVSLYLRLIIVLFAIQIRREYDLAALMITISCAIYAFGDLVYKCSDENSCW